MVVSRNQPVCVPPKICVQTISLNPDFILIGIVDPYVSVVQAILLSKICLLLGGIIFKIGAFL